MNDIQELVSHGITKATAELMLNDYAKRIGTFNEDYEIIDINYNFEKHGKDITLQCRRCGKVIHRLMIKGRNKWSELIKTCADCKAKQRKQEAEIQEKIKHDELQNKIGKIYGDYIITGFESGKPDKLLIKCTTCGHETRVSYLSVKNGRWGDRKCHKHYKQPIKYDETYIGKRYGRLRVEDITKEFGKRKLKCICDCGKRLFVRPVDLENGAVKSCGCIKVDISKNAISHDRLYHVWQDIKTRCNNRKSNSYHNYGGRGIKVCEEWESNYLAFKKWAYSNGYDENARFGECTIDRIDVNGNYEPSNCRWISNLEQQKNKRPSCEWKKRHINRRAMVKFKGELIPKYDLCQRCGISVEMFNYRTKIKGMTVEEALFTPKLTVGRPKKILTL